jgi:hypothetical protein
VKWEASVLQGTAEIDVREMMSDTDPDNAQLSAPLRNGDIQQTTVRGSYEISNPRSNLTKGS